MPDSATIMYGQAAHIGSRVKHYGQRWTGYATATVVGFREEPGHFYKGRPWVKVVVQHDNPDDAYAVMLPKGWDWDRTELAPDPMDDTHA